MKAAKAVDLTVPQILAVLDERIAVLQQQRDLLREFLAPVPRGFRVTAAVDPRVAVEATAKAKGKAGRKHGATRARVAEYVKRKPAAAPSEIAAALHLTADAVKYHLRHLSPTKEQTAS